MNHPRMDFELSLLDLLGVLRRRGRWILGATALASLIALALSFLVSPRYESVTSLLPGRSNVVRAYIPLLERGKIQGGLKFGNVTTRNSHNLEIMASDRLQYRLIKDLNLVTFYGHDDLAALDSSLAQVKTLADLRRDTSFGLSLQLQVLFTRVTTTDAEMSALIANRYLDLLDAINLELYQRFAAEKTRFLDEQLAALGEKILKADRDLSRFHQRHGLADFEEERSGLFDLTDKLRQQLMDKELSLGNLSLDLNTHSPKRLELEAEIDVISGMLGKLSTSFGGDGASMKSSGSDLPDMNTRFARLKHERRLLQAVEGQLIGERESARLQSIMDTGTITVLDRAYISHEPVWPDKKLIIGLTAAIMLVLGSLVSVGVEFLLFRGGGSMSAGWCSLLGES